MEALCENYNVAIGRAFSEKCTLFQPFCQFFLSFSDEIETFSSLGSRFF